MTPNRASGHAQRLTDSTLRQPVVAQRLNRQGFVHTQLISHRRPNECFFRSETRHWKTKAPLSQLVPFQAPFTGTVSAPTDTIPPKPRIATFARDNLACATSASTPSADNQAT